MTAWMFANDIVCVSFSMNLRTHVANHKLVLIRLKRVFFVLSGRSNYHSTEQEFESWFDFVCVSFNMKLRTHVANHKTRFDSIKTSFFSSVGSMESSLNRTRIWKLIETNNIVLIQSKRGCVRCSFVFLLHNFEDSRMFWSQDFHLGYTTRF